MNVGDNALVNPFPKTKNNNKLHQCSNGFMTPSDYLKQITQTTDELQLNSKAVQQAKHEIISLVTDSKTQRSIVDIEQPLFVVSPSQDGLEGPSHMPKRERKEGKKEKRPKSENFDFFDFFSIFSIFLFLSRTFSAVFLLASSSPPNRLYK